MPRLSKYTLTGLSSKTAGKSLEMFQCGQQEQSRRRSLSTRT